VFGDTGFRPGSRGPVCCHPDPFDFAQDKGPAKDLCPAVTHEGSANFPSRLHVPTHVGNRLIFEGHGFRLGELIVAQKSIVMPDLNPRKKCCVIARLDWTLVDECSTCAEPTNPGGGGVGSGGAGVCVDARGAALASTFGGVSICVLAFSAWSD
jgi:hypothetical protein